MKVFNRWKVGAKKPVEVIFYKDHREIAKIVTEFRKWKQPKLCQCYFNSALLLQVHPDVRYVSGFVHDGTEVLEHAWNSYRGIHFDVTDQVARRLQFNKDGISHEHFKRYKALFTLDHRQWDEMHSVAFAYDSFHEEYWRRFVLGEPIEEVRLKSKTFMSHPGWKQGKKTCHIQWEYCAPKWEPIFREDS